MKTVKLLVAALFTVTSCLLARVDVYNHLDLPVKVEIHYIGVASPWTGEIEAGGSHVNDYLMKDLANIKTGYVVWVKEKNSYRKIISETGLSDPGAFRKLDIIQHKDPETGEILYSLYRSGY